MSSIRRAPTAAGHNARRFLFFTGRSARVCLCLLALACLLSHVGATQAATLPAGFFETQLANGLSNPTAMAFAPDGRLFVCLQDGQLRVIKNNALLATPFLTVAVDASGERGLLGVAFDPNFATNQFVYIYYTANTTPRHNRVSRFTANGDVAAAGSEVVILQLENLSATNHNGGAIHFGPDGKLYVAVGENAVPANAQTLANRLGKMLRINPDGTIPTDNPFYHMATGANRSIWALGLRNPFTFAFQPGTGRMFINDVGQSAFEEINDGIAGANYGWDLCEGACSPTNPNFRDPIFAYGRTPQATGGCAIAGGAFYNPANVRFPGEYIGKYFFADLCSGWIRVLDTATFAASSFATGISQPVDLKVGADGNLYYLARGGGGVVYRVSYSSPPVGNITAPVAGALYRAGDSINYAGEATDAEDGPLPSSAFTWRVDFHHGGDAQPFIPATTGATGGSFTIPTTGETSANVWYRIHLTVRDSSGLTHSMFRDVLPHKSTLTFVTSPAGLQITLDGQTQTTPFAVESVVGIRRTLGVVSPQTLSGATYDFASWSDGGAAAHEIATPAAATTYTATFNVRQTTATLQLSSASYTAHENDSRVEIIVRRTGATAGSVAVDYATSDETATDRSDYTTTLGTLTFAPDETAKSIFVLLMDNLRLDGARSFRLTLSNPTGSAGLGEPSAASIVVNDNDTAASPDNPIDAARYFVRQHYLDFLNRAPDEAGLDFWANQITACESLPAGERPLCRETRRVNVSAAFFLSIEFQETGFLVYRLYRAGFGRIPRYREFLRDTQEIARGVVVGVGDWQQRLNENQQAYIENFIARAEFAARFPGSITPEEYVSALSGAALTQAEREALANGLRQGTETRASVLRKVVTNDNFARVHTNPAFVLMEYFGYLRRNPDDPPDTDFAGYDFWLDKLVRANGDYNAAQMVTSFILSIEYRARFGPP